MFVLIVICAGCVRYHPRSVSLEDNAAAFQNRSLTDSNLERFLNDSMAGHTQSPMELWNLDRLTATAIYFDPSLRVVKAQTAVVDATLLTAKARPNPTVGFSPGYNLNAARGVSPWIIGSTIDMPVETAGKRSKRVLQSRYNAQAARLALLSSVWQVRSNVQNATIQFFVASKRANAVEQQLEAQSALVKLLEQRAAAGAIARTEAAPFQVARIRLLSDMAIARATAVQATNRLAEVLGLPPSAIRDITLSELPARASESAITNLSELRRTALRNRSDVLELLARYEAAQAALQLEIAKQYPDVHLGSGYQWDQGENKWNLAITLELPILNRNQGPIAEGEARRSEAAARIFEAQAHVAIEIDGLVASVKSAEEEFNRSEEALTALRRQAELAKERFGAGGADSVELQTAIVDERSAEIVTLEAQARLEVARAQLDSALQAPTDFVNTLFVAYLSLP
jgi:cobalt-zinc-cadmium efflux system outer membrane protein